MATKNALAVLKQGVTVEYVYQMGGSRTAIFSLNGKTIQSRNVGNGSGYCLWKMDERLYEWLDLRVEGIEFVRDYNTFAISREAYDRAIAEDPDCFLKGWD
jgi:hypothetical protein